MEQVFCVLVTMSSLGTKISLLTVPKVVGRWRKYYMMAYWVLWALCFFFSLLPLHLRPVYFDHILVQIHILEDSTTTSECWLQASPVIESLKIQSTIVSDQLLLGDEVCGKTSEFHGHAHYCTSFAVKWAPLLEVMLCGIPWQWIRHSEIERFWF